jgi:hypothetical protein
MRIQAARACVDTMHIRAVLQAGYVRRMGSIAPKRSYPPLPDSYFAPKPAYTDFSQAQGRTTADFPFLFIADFITDKEHDLLAAEAEKDLKRRRYEAGHWDAVISHFREQSKGFSRWSPDCQAVFERVRALFPRPTQLMMPSAHVLDLDKLGIIDHHIDSVKFSGDIVCGISLLSDSIMELRHDPDSVFVKDYVRAEGAPVIDEKAAAQAPRVRVLLPKKSLYMVM